MKFTFISKLTHWQIGILSLSWKNIWRNKSRSLIIIFAIVFGVIGGVGFTSFMNGMIIQRLQMAIGNEVSNIQIHNSLFKGNKEINDTIFDMPEIKSTLDTCSEIKAYTERLKLVCMINSANGGQGIMLNGIDPQKEKQVTGIYQFVKKGDYFSDNRKNGILISEKIAEKLKLKLHSKVVITMQSISGNITTAAFKVIGIFKTSNSTFDGMSVFVRKVDLAKLIGVSRLTAHEIAISVYDDNKSVSLISTLKNKFNNSQLSIESWKEVMPELDLMNGMMNYLLYIFMSIIFLALSFGIINTMLMAVMERVREIGMLMAIGMNRLKVFMMIMLETILLMLTGSAVGMFLSWLLVSYFGKHGIDLSMFESGMAGFGFNSMVYPYIDINVYIKIVIMVIIAGIVSAVVPARKALKLNPSEAIRKL
jgi:ABC-type lipoprotein release transport system permease subunit